MTTDLNAFSSSEKAHLMSLFYRVGVWISHADDAGAEIADAVEAAMLTRLLQKVVDNPARTALVRDIAAEALRQRGNWARWAAQIDTFIPDAQQGVRILKPVCGQDEVMDFIYGLRALGEAVAMASDEDAMAEDVSEALGGSLLTRIRDALFPPRKACARNISPLEDNALTELARALNNV
ncbi:MAG: hypothetical protein V4621_00805 [Pseudomonadota bacterium]